MQHIYVGFLQNTVFELFFYFLWWSVFGWFLEVVDRTLETGGFENRGFLNGPICPIYGFGVIIITHVLAPLKGDFLVLYVLSVAICTSFELFVGVLMEKTFHAKWWDYSEEKFNYRGFICLRISLLWGVGSVLVICVVHPLIEKLVAKIPYLGGNIFAAVVTTIIVIDIIATLSDIRQFNMRLKQVDYIATLLHDKSIALGENISDEVLVLNAKYEKLSEQIKTSRIVRAFPTMKPLNYTRTFKVIKSRISNKFRPEDYDEKYENTRLLIESVPAAGTDDKN
ncbi:putative ABC transporter permease [Ruminococcus sp. HUN007]|uniref:putative ABC transporter permease n=1 Tax=Ruminococcus sp. HUN007 TaxID=1514668 RepID=UPI000678599C|nr:putative ABC transporter permease [Ruminococcus sp. HUN007]